MAPRTIFPFGVDGSSCEFAFNPATPEELAERARRHLDPPDLEDLDSWRLSKQRRLRRGKSGNLAEAGWGVIFASGDPQEGELREALKPLLDLRKSQAGRVSARYYREFRGGEGYQQETKEAFLERFGIGPGPADPNYVPYYLLIVGSPETIPFSFQYELDIQYGVGRICFDTVKEYANYACAVVAAETSPPQRPRAATFFAPRHPGDYCTELSSGWLAKPLAAHVESHCPGWEVRSLLGPDASKLNLQRSFGGDETPSFLFTASHGIVYPAASAEYQHDYQGSLLCNDWPGPQGPRGSMTRDRYFCAQDLNDKAHLAGLVSFIYACHSAGTPAIKDFQPQSQEPVQAAPQPFISALARRLLGHPGGGALAVIGHIESTWTNSIQWGGIKEPQIQVFEDAVTSLLGGEPVGAAMEVFGERYAELATSLSRELQLIRTGQKKEDADRLANLWTACNDARNYIVLGDPAVRLAAAGAAS